MNSIHGSNERLAELFAQFQLDKADAPAPTPHEFTIGTSNPALADLKRRRARLGARQDRLIDQLDRFYEDVQSPKANVQLGFAPVSGTPPSAIPQEQLTTLRRRASFLLNMEAMDSLPDVIQEIYAQPDLPASSAVKLEANAILNSTKKHTEHVIAAALEDAREANRVCPLPLQPLKFSIFLEVNRAHLRNVVSACRSPQPARDQLLKRALESFAEAYFASSREYDGAPKTRPREVMVMLNSAASSDITANRLGHIRANIAIDSAGAEQFCRTLRANADRTSDDREMLRTHMLKGFETLPMEKKLAGLYVQLLIQELAEVQETMGVESVDMPEHGHAAQQAAARTLEEWDYMGNPGFGEAIHRDGGPLSQREMSTELVGMLGGLDQYCVEETGTPLITMPEIRSWMHSPAMPIDLRALREPSSRLLLQVPALTGRALLDLPEFKD